MLADDLPLLPAMCDEPGIGVVSKAAVVFAVGAAWIELNIEVEVLNRTSGK